MSSKDFEIYWEKNFKICQKIESKFEFFKLKSLVEEIFIKPNDPQILKIDSPLFDSRANSFLKKFVDANYSNFDSLGFRLSQIQDQENPTQIQTHNPRTAPISVKKHACLITENFLKEISKIFGERNLIILPSLQILEAKLLSLQKFNMCFELTRFISKTIKIYAETTGHSNRITLGVYLYKLAKLSAYLERPDEAFVYSDIAIKYLKQYPLLDLLELNEIREDSLKFLASFRVDISHKKKELEQEFLIG